VTRYVGTGEGRWTDPTDPRVIAPAAYIYRPSVDDRLLARDVAEGIAERVTAWRRTRTGYGLEHEAKPVWYVTGFLGEVAALHPIGSGPDLAQWEGEHWFGSSDFGRLEVRTTSSWQLYGSLAAKHAKQPGLGGWRITRKDAGRAIVCVEDRDADLLVLGWAEADDVPRLPAALGLIIAVVDPSELRGLRELDVYAEARARLELAR
jgi:hypothetical protein